MLLMTIKHVNTQLEILQLKVDISNSVNVMLSTKFKYSYITKGNNFLIMPKRVMVLLHCISPHRDLSTI